MFSTIIVTLAVIDFYRLTNKWVPKPKIAIQCRISWRCSCIPSGKIKILHPQKYSISYGYVAKKWLYCWTFINNYYMRIWMKREKGTCIL